MYLQRRWMLLVVLGSLCLATDAYAIPVALTQTTAITGETGDFSDGAGDYFGIVDGTAAMIAGADDFGRPIRLAGQVIGGDYISTASGSGFAGPMWGDAMQAIDDRLPNDDFVAPSAVDVRGVMTTVPQTGGMRVEDAQNKLADAGFSVTIGSQRDSGYPVGTVAYTDPGGGSQAPSGRTITIYPSDGTPYVPPKPDKKKKKGNDKKNGKNKN